MKKLKFVFLLGLLVLLVSSCEKIEIQSDLLDEDESSELKSAKVKAVPFKSIFSTWLVSEGPIFDESVQIGFSVVVEGEGNATHMGKSHVRVSQEWYPVGYPIEGKAEITFTAANGDEMTADFKGFMYPNEIFSYMDIEGECTITGGTGRFADAEGTLNLVAFFDKPNNSGESIWTGEIKY
jgi:hypothetical protein